MREAPDIGAVRTIGDNQPERIARASCAREPANRMTRTALTRRTATGSHASERGKARHMRLLNACTARFMKSLKVEFWVRTGSGYVLRITKNLPSTLNFLLQNRCILLSTIHNPQSVALNHQGGTATLAPHSTHSIYNSRIQLGERLPLPARYFECIIPSKKSRYFTQS